MRSIALVSSSFLPRVGGVEEHVRHLAAELRDRGHRVAVWTVDQGDPPVGVPGVTVRHLPAPLPSASPRGVAHFAAAAPGALRSWRRALRQDEPELLHLQCFGPNGPWATALAGLHGLPLVVGAHGETFMDADRVFEESRVQRAALRWALRRADAVTACSAYAAADLARFGFDPSGARVVANGVDGDEPAGPAPDGLPRRYLLGLGRLVRVKGFDLLLRAFARARLDPDVHLVLAGDGPERTALERLAADLGVADRVALPGALDRGAVVTVTRGAEALVVPSRVEAFGIVVLEGLRAGVPVVVSSRGGAAEVVRDGVDGLLADPESEGGLATALERLGDPELRARLGAQGRRTAAAYTWTRVADQVEDVYREVLP